MRFLPLTTLTGAFLLCCSACSNFGANYPEAVLQKAEGRAIRALYVDRRIGRIVANPTKQKIELKVIEVTLSDGNKERLAFLTFANDGYEYLGKLEKLQADIPLEFIMLELNKSRFIITWVEENVAKRPSFVTLGRPKQLPVDDSMNVLRTGEVDNRVAVIYIPESEAQLWSQLRVARVSERGSLEYVFDKILEPSLGIESGFIEVNK